MTIQTLKMEELEKQKLQDVFQNLLTDQVILIVQLPDGKEILIQPNPPLKPLPVFKGYIPEGWKEAIYR